MKTPITLLIAAAGFAVAALGATPQPPQPGPEHQKMAVWIGEWTYEGETQTTPLGPGAKFTGRLTTRPVLNGFAVECLYVEQGVAGETQGHELCWYDPVAKKFAYVYLSNDGYVEQGPFTMSGDLCTWEANCVAGGTAFKMKGVETVSSDGLALTRKAEITVDGRAWLPFFASRFTKVKATANDAATVERELIKLEQEWAKAYVARDIAMLDRLEADDYTFTDQDGVAWTKAEDIGSVKSGEFVATSFVSDDIKVRVYGDTAVVFGRNTLQATYQGKDMSGQSRWTDTWVKRNGLWQCVATHSSKIAPPAADIAAHEKTLIQLEHDWARALVAADVTALARLLADEWVGTDPEGVVKSKAQTLQDISSGKFDASAATASNMKVTIHGDTAVVIGLWPEAAVFDGKDVSGTYQFTDTFIQRDGRWLCVASHSSKIPQK